MNSCLLRSGLPAALLALAAATGLRAVTPPLKMTAFDSPAAAAKGATAPILTVAPDGPVWLAWAEPAEEGGQTLRCAAYADGAWSKTKPIVRSQNLALGGELAPALAAGANNDLAAIWPEPNHTAKFSLSPDRGLTWTTPVQLSKESLDVSLPAVCIVGSGEPLAVWLDGRTVDKSAQPTRVKLYTRYLSGPLAGSPDWMLAEDAVAGCAPQIYPLIDGGAIVGYRAVDDEGHMVGHTIRLHNRRWKMGDPMSPDPWIPKPASTPAVRIAVDGGRVGAVWFGGAAEHHGDRIYASVSPEAGARFLLAATEAEGPGLQKPEVALLHDGALLTVWLTGSAVHLRRLTPELYSDDQTPLGRDTPPASGQPQLAVLQDYSGDASSARILLAYPTGGAAPAVRTFLVTIPEGDLLAAADSDCHCAPTPGQLLGYPVRGTIKSIDADRNSLSVDLDPVPGIMDPGVHDFKATASVLMSVRVGSIVMARIDRQGNSWKMFEVHAMQ